MLRFELVSGRLGLLLRGLLVLLPLVSQPSLRQQVGNAVQKRLNSFLGNRCGDSSSACSAMVRVSGVWDGRQQDGWRDTNARAKSP